MHQSPHPRLPARLELLRLVAILLALSSSLVAREFDFHRDTFAFSNDTVFQYGIDEQGQLQIHTRAKPVEFSHRCFVLTRAVLQFHQFATFQKNAPTISRTEYAQRIRQICRIPVWSRRSEPRIIIPGYADLYCFSKAYEGLLKEHLGNWLPTYLRIGNWRMAMGHPRSGQASVATWLSQSLENHQPRALYLARFPHLNHVVIPYAQHLDKQGNIHFSIYDPNYPDQPTWLLYKPSQRSFEFAPRWYFPGGRVNVMRVYISPFH